MLILPYFHKIFHRKVQNHRNPKTPQWSHTHNPVHLPSQNWGNSNGHFSQLVPQSPNHNPPYYHSWHLHTSSVKRFSAVHWSLVSVLHKLKQVMKINYKAFKTKGKCQIERDKVVRIGPFFKRERIVSRFYRSEFSCVVFILNVLMKEL